jgi:GR25 family glycosyltransferase involved in LPS biosynthesis
LTYIKKFLSIIYLYFRWFKRNIDNFLYPIDSSDISIDALEFIYINLDHRVDRRVEIESEFHKLGIINYKRYPAIKNSFGALGCALSHERVLEVAKSKVTPTVICEDDALFLINRTLLEGIVSKFYKDPRLDVLCLAYNEFNKIRVGRDFYVSSDVQTMACYIAKEYVLQDLCKVAKISISRLSEGGAEEEFAIDQVWKSLQKKYFFCFPIVRAVKQRPSYSDIRDQDVIYGS